MWSLLRRMWSFLPRLFNRFGPLEAPQEARDFNVPDRPQEPASVRIPVSWDPSTPGKDGKLEVPSPAATTELISVSPDSFTASKDSKFEALSPAAASELIPTSQDAPTPGKDSKLEAPFPAATTELISVSPDSFTASKDSKLEVLSPAAASEAHLSEFISKDIHPCECGKVVAWLPSPTGRPQPYEIKRDISIAPDGTRTVVVSNEDIHHCEQYSDLADLVRNAIDRSYAKEIRIRLPAAEPFVLSWSRGKTEVDVSNGRTGENRRWYGSINLKTGGYRVRHRSSSLKDLLDRVNRDPYRFDWSVSGSQTDCCFCGRSLNDPRSVRWGYGPTCAAKYGLPWG